MSWRMHPPVWSPVTAGGLARATRAEARRNAAAALEARLVAEHGARAVALTSSGTAALTVAMAASRSGRPRVALPAWGCPDLATAAQGANASVLFYDLDPAKLAPERLTLERAARSGADLVVVAHFFGVPVDLDGLRSAIPADALVIDDAAQAYGASLHGGPLGAAGDLGVLSFGRGKGRTGGSGGALVATSDRGAAALAAAASRLGAANGAPARELASLAAMLVLGRPSLYRVPASLPWLRLGQAVHHPPSPPRRISPFAAALLLETSDAVSREARHRREAGEWWRERLAGHPALAIPVPPEGSRAGWLRLPVVVRPGLEERLAEPDLRALGVARAYPVPIPELRGVTIERQEGAAFPGAATLARRLFTLPTHGRISDRARTRLLNRLLALR